MDLRPPPKFERENRRNARRKVKLDGVVRTADGQVCACEVRDISKTGAQLILAVMEEVSSEFLLEIPGNAKVMRRCSLVRQDGLKVGLRFLT